MAIPILGEIERLINEHGSAAILKERLALAADQYAVLERKLSESETRTEAAETRLKEVEVENQRLELDNFKLKDKVRDLEGQLIAPSGQRLEEVREQLLQLLAAQTDRITASQAAHALQIGEQLAKYHLTEMEKESLVSAAHFYNGRPTDYVIAQGGRACLVSHGLLR